MVGRVCVRVLPQQVAHAGQYSPHRTPVHGVAGAKQKTGTADERRETTKLKTNKRRMGLASAPPIVRSLRAWDEINASLLVHNLRKQISFGLPMSWGPRPCGSLFG